jgi:hypothetical protein
MSRKVDGAPDGLAVSVATVGTTAVQLVPARASRRKLYLYAGNGGYIGSDSSVTTSTGFPVNQFVNPQQTPLETAAAVWAIHSSSTTIAVLETFDEET